MIEKLSEEQKKFIDKNYIQIPDVDQLTKTLFNNDKLDGRNKEGKLVAAYMIERGYGYKTRSHKKAKKITLTEDQKNLILEYHNDDKLNSLQIAQMIFQDREVKNLSKEQRVVSDFLKTHSGDFLRPIEDKKNCSVYDPPKTHEECIEKINKFTSANLPERFNSLKKQDKDCVQNLMNSLASPRFIQILNTYTEQDGFLFEAEYVRAVWDKPDLTSDELNLYINVCVDYVNLKTIQRNMEKLNRMFDECEDQTEMSVKLAEILKAKSSEYHQCEQRQESLIKKLNGDRSVRMKNRENDFASVLNLVQSFQQKEERDRMIEIAEKQKLAVSEEVDNLESMDAWKSRILGLRREDVL
jgi:hypothetical protein